MRPLFVDVEASGFGRGSYPIEIGVALGDGETNCMIIQPEPDWLHWDKQAELLHGISRETLETFGRAPVEAAIMLNEVGQGQLMYSDAWGNDSCWLALLFERAGVEQQFKLESVRSLLTEQQVVLWHQVKADIIRNSSFARHRASNDAWVLQQTYCQILAAKN